MGVRMIEKPHKASAAATAFWIVSACAQAAECAGNGNSGLPCPAGLSHVNSALAAMWISAGALLLLGPPLLVVSLIKFAWRTGVQGVRLGGKVAVAVVILRWLGIMRTHSSTGETGLTASNGGSECLGFLDMAGHEGAAVLLDGVGCDHRRVVFGRTTFTEGVERYSEPQDALRDDGHTIRVSSVSGKS